MCTILNNVLKSFWFKSLKKIKIETDSYIAS